MNFTSAELYECWVVGILNCTSAVLYECWLELSDYSKSWPLHPTHPIYSQQPSVARKTIQWNPCNSSQGIAEEMVPADRQEDPMLDIPAPLANTALSANTQLSLVTKHLDVIKTPLSQLSVRKWDTHNSKNCDAIVASHVHWTYTHHTFIAALRMDTQ